MEFWVNFDGIAKLAEFIRHNDHRAVDADGYYVGDFLLHWGNCLRVDVESLPKAVTDKFEFDANSARGARGSVNEVLSLIADQLSSSLGWSVTKVRDTFDIHVEGPELYRNGHIIVRRKLYSVG